MWIKDLAVLYFFVYIISTLPVDYKFILKREVSGILCIIPYSSCKCERVEQIQLKNCLLSPASLPDLISVI